MTKRSVNPREPDAGDQHQAEPAADQITAPVKDVLPAPVPGHQCRVREEEIETEHYRIAPAASSGRDAERQQRGAEPGQLVRDLLQVVRCDDPEIASSADEALVPEVLAREVGDEERG